MDGQRCSGSLQRLARTQQLVKLFLDFFKMTSSSEITTESGGRQNIFPIEAQIQVVENYSSYSEDAEKANGRWAMIGLIAFVGSYISTGQIIPGVF